MPFRETARAKINLTLRVHGRRADGYHEIESLVAFAEIGDRVVFTPGAECRVVTSGPFAGDIDGPNLLDRALALLSELDAKLQLGTVHLEKNLPVAAGLGGGSADVAALLRAVRRANPERAGAIAWHALAARLGADVPVCLAGTPALISGIGERIEPLGSANQWPPIPRSSSIRGCPCRRPRSIRPSPQDLLQPGASGQRCRRPWPTCRALSASCAAHGNDLERPATALLPAVADIKAALAAQPGCRIAAMSGSGPTCFGLFVDEASAARATAALASRHPRWWVVATQLAGSSAPGPSDATNVGS